MNPENRTFSLPVEHRLLFKAECRLEACRILQKKQISHMTETQIASELYFHALVWHVCEFLRSRHIHLNWLQRHADPIDLTDYGDTLFRRVCFRIFWILPGPRHPDQRQDR